MADDDLLEAQAELFGTIFVVTQHLTRRADAALASLALTTHQWLLLAVLTKWSPDRCPSLSEAASRYGTSRQNVKQIALGLQSRGFLHLVPDPDDGRTTRLVLTDRVGVFDEPDMQARAVALLADACAGLTPDETIALRDLVGRWLAAISVPGEGHSGRRPARRGASAPPGSLEGNG